jgi:hypothetical protein
MRRPSNELLATIRRGMTFWLCFDCTEAFAPDLDESVPEHERSTFDG